MHTSYIFQCNASYVPNHLISVSDLEPPEDDVGDDECTVDIDSFWSQITKEIIANGFVTGEMVFVTYDICTYVLRMILIYFFNKISLYCELALL